MKSFISEGVDDDGDEGMFKKKILKNLATIKRCTLYIEQQEKTNDDVYKKLCNIAFIKAMDKKKKRIRLNWTFCYPACPCREVTG